MKKIKIILTTFSNKNDAIIFANKIVKQQYSPCVQIFPSIKSVYQWEGKVNNEEEILLLIKVRNEYEQKLILWINQNHPYKVPEIVSINSKLINKKYISWFFSI